MDAKEGASNAQVQGNVYAGPNGLNVSGNGDTLSIGGSSSRLVVSHIITNCFCQHSH